MSEIDEVTLEINEYVCPRDPVTSFLAAVAMPGLEEVAAPMIPALTPDEAMSVVVHVMARAAVGSHIQATSLLVCTDVWDMARLSASRVGRTLPLAPPTYSKYSKARAKLAPEVVAEVQDRLTAVSVDLAQSLGLLDPSAPFDPLCPARGNSLFGDATTFDQLRHWVNQYNSGHLNKDTDALELDDGVAAPDTVKKKKGQPVAVVAGRDDRRNSRVLMGADPYTDGKETGAVMPIFERVVHYAGAGADPGGGGVHAIDYDRLFSDPFIERTMRLGIIGIARMSAADPNAPHVESGVKDPVQRKASRKRANKGDVKKPKKLLRLYRLPDHTHTADDGTTCRHTCWSVDGSLVLRSDDGPPTTDEGLVHPAGLRWADGPDGWYLVATYSVVAECGELTLTFDLGSKFKKGALVQVLRPLPESGKAHWIHFGHREDAESTMNSVKGRQSTYGRASAATAEGFALDVVGIVLLENSVAWDVHVALHTRAAQHHARRRERRLAKAR